MRNSLTFEVFESIAEANLRTGHDNLCWDNIHKIPFDAIKTKSKLSQWIRIINFGKIIYFVKDKEKSDSIEKAKKFVKYFKISTII